MAEFWKRRVAIPSCLQLVLTNLSGCGRFFKYLNWKNSEIARERLPGRRWVFACMCWQHDVDSLMKILGKVSGNLVQNWNLCSFLLVLKWMSPFNFMYFTLTIKSLRPAGAQVVVIMVTNQDQAQSVLYGPHGAVSGKSLLFCNILCDAKWRDFYLTLSWLLVPAMTNGAVVVLCSTVSPDYVRQLEAQLKGSWPIPRFQ